jgi:LPS-assembly protein
LTGRGNRGDRKPLRLPGAGLGALLLAAALGATPAAAQLLPPGFFDNGPSLGGEAQVEAAMLSYDAVSTVISAEGAVIMSYEGYDLTADRITYNQTTGETFAEGNVAIKDPQGNVYQMDRVELTAGFREAFIDSLTLTTSKGALIRADDIHYAEELQTTLTNASYSPCGLCIDSKGRRIGWKVNASKIVYDRDRALVFLEGAGLELLGVPVAWIPWFVIPDPSQPRAQGFRTPSVNYKGEYGARLDVPYFVPLAEDMDLLLSPTVMTRQGFLMAAEFNHRVPWGNYNIAASGLYQFDPAAFAGRPGDRAWRGSIQTSGTFTALEDWTMGWSYTAFTDAAYLIDYDFLTSENSVNELYATYLTRDLYFDARVRQYNRLGDYFQADQDRQAREIPRMEAASYHDLGEFGRVDLSATVIGVMRDLDSFGSYNGVPYVFGYEGTKLHATFEAAWQDQYVLPGGLLATPYLGGRLDAGYFARTDPALPAPYATPVSNVSMLSATPIAAMDVRWPLIAVNGYDSHLFEPIAQLVYRGSPTTMPAFTNDNAQSFVFDDTLLFSYDRFSGTDRQETGLRANVGGRYMANFEDGSWLSFVAGQSFHLAGTNALGIIDHAQTGNSTGLGTTASYIVAGVSGSPAKGFTLGGKVQFDPNTLRFMRAAAATRLNLFDTYDFNAAYTYIPANPAIGTLADQHEASISVKTPLPFDYWYADGGLSWDIASNQWLAATAGITYDDGYFVAGAFGKFTGPTHERPNTQTFGIRFRLRGPDGEWGL